MAGAKSCPQLSVLDLRIEVIFLFVWIFGGVVFLGFWLVGLVLVV